MCDRFAMILCLMSLTMSATAQESKWTYDLTHSIDQAKAVWSVPGSSVVVVRSKQVVLMHQVGEADSSTHTKLKPDTLFPIASCTKAFTSAAISALVDDGKLTWDDPVRKHLPTVRFADSRLDDLMTLRDLLSHRSGLGPHDLLWYRASWRLEDVVRRIPEVPLSGQFRSSFQYSSVPVILAGAAVANRYGDNWPALVQDKISKPLDLKSAVFTTTEARKTGQLANGHNTKGVMNTWEMTEPNPAGSLYLNTTDVGKWLQFHLSNGTVDGKVIVSKKHLDETKAPTTIIPMDDMVKAQNPLTKLMGYALGWVVYDYHGELVVAHGGLIDGFRVNMVLLPERDLAFAILNNLHQTRMNLALTNTLLDVLLDKPTQDWNKYYQKLEQSEAAVKEEQRRKRNSERNAREPATRPLPDYAKTYSNKIYSEATVTIKDKKLELRFSSFTMMLEHWQGDTFRCTGPDFEDELVEFEVTSDDVKSLKFRELHFKKK